MSLDLTDDGSTLVQVPWGNKPITWTNIDPVLSRHIDGIVPKGPYLPCVSMSVRPLLAGYPRCGFTRPQWVELNFLPAFGTNYFNASQVLSRTCWPSKCHISQHKLQTKGPASFRFVFQFSSASELSCADIILENWKMFLLFLPFLNTLRCPQGLKSSRMGDTYPLFYIISTIVADDLVMQGARTSADIVLT